MSRNPIAKDLRTPKYRPRVVPNKRRRLVKAVDSNDLESSIPAGMKLNEWQSYLVRVRS